MSDNNNNGGNGLEKLVQNLEQEFQSLPVEERLAHVARIGLKAVELAQYAKEQWEEWQKRAEVAKNTARRVAAEAGVSPERLLMIFAEEFDKFEPETGGHVDALQGLFAQQKQGLN